MPKGVPVATMSVGKSGAINAAILTAEIISLQNSSLVEKLQEFKKAGSKL
jgi:phosphoribosylcarboxyaminoimidazole (NCAIR) mutase